MNVVNDRNNFDHYCLKNTKLQAKTKESRIKGTLLSSTTVKLSDELAGEGKAISVLTKPHCLE